MEHTAPLRDIAVSDSGFVFDPHSGVTYTVNATGRAVIDAIREGLDRDDIVEILDDGFDTEGADLHRDVDEFVHLLKRAGLVDSGFSF